MAATNQRVTRLFVMAQTGVVCSVVTSVAADGAARYLALFWLAYAVGSYWLDHENRVGNGRSSE